VHYHAFVKRLNMKKAIVFKMKGLNLTTQRQLTADWTKQ